MQIKHNNPQQTELSLLIFTISVFPVPANAKALTEMLTEVWKVSVPSSVVLLLLTIINLKTLRLNELRLN